MIRARTERCVAPCHLRKSLNNRAPSRQVRKVVCTTRDCKLRIETKAVENSAVRHASQRIGTRCYARRLKAGRRVTTGGKGDGGHSGFSRFLAATATYRDHADISSAITSREKFDIAVRGRESAGHPSRRTREPPVSAVHSNSTAGIRCTPHRNTRALCKLRPFPSDSDGARGSGDGSVHGSAGDASPARRSKRLPRARPVEQWEPPRQCSQSPTPLRSIVLFSIAGSPRSPFRSHRSCPATVQSRYRFPDPPLNSDSAFMISKGPAPKLRKGVRRLGRKIVE